MSTNTSVRHMPVAERPRERLLAAGAHTLSNQELLAIILNSGTKRASSLELAERLLQRWQSLRNLADASMEEIMQEAGMGIAKAAGLLAAWKLSPGDVIPVAHDLARRELDGYVR